MVNTKQKPGKQLCYRFVPLSKGASWLWVVVATGFQHTSASSFRIAVVDDFIGSVRVWVCADMRDADIGDSQF
jgi:hypothetical protein